MGKGREGDRAEVLAIVRAFALPSASSAASQAARRPMAGCACGFRRGRARALGYAPADNWSVDIGSR
jgi:hypothetical protein